MHNAKWKTLWAWLLLCCFVLSSCSTGIPLQDETVTMTLPPSPVQHVAPIGDASLEYMGEVALYFPRHDSTRLLSITESIPLSPTRPRAESIVRALLTHEGNGMVAPLGGSTRLALYGANPVEVSHDVATVNLAASALQLDRKEFYVVCQAIANTLTLLPDIHYVNVLVMDKPLGLDIAGTLPMGTFSRSIGEDVGAVYDQLLSQRVNASEAPSSKGLTSMVTLYFPLAGLDGIMSEARSLSFTSQEPAAMAQRLLQELSAGPQQLVGSPALPVLSDLLEEDPAVAPAPEGGGNLISLKFSPTLDDMLSAFGMNRANCFAAICYTLSTFLPGTAGISMTIGDEMVYSVPLTGQTTGQMALLFTGGVQHRAEYAAFLLDHCTLYFADEAGQKLVASERAIPYYQCTNPRALLLELSKGPQPQDSAADARPIMEEGILKDSDLLGFSLSGDTLLVNFAPTFTLVGRNLAPQEDRLLAYGLVNTLTALTRIRRVCFFVAGDIPMDFTGEIYWAGDFYKNLGLVHPR